MLNRILSYVKIVKVESNAKNERAYFYIVEVHAISF